MMYISLPVVAIAIFYNGCYVAQSQLANCFAGGRCRNNPISFGLIEQCCNSSDILRSYNRPSFEACEECVFNYRCYVSEQCGNNPPAVLMTSFAINDGERLCCNGTFASWDLSNSPLGSSPCTVCPEPATTVAMSTSSEMPLTTTEMETDSSPQTTTVNVDPAQSGFSVGCSTGCIVGIVVGCVILVILIAAIVISIVVPTMINKMNS